MKTALENPHYKKIWEKVIMNKHPEAKNLEEAFKAEKGLCEYKVEVAWFGMNNGIPSDSTLPSLFAKLGAINEKTFFKIGNYKNTGYSYIGGDIFKTSINQYLGNPITLEDVLILFGKTFNQTLNAFKFIQLTSEGAFITMKPIEHPLHRIEVILGKPLHEQTPETWKGIANLID